MHDEFLMMGKRLESKLRWNARKRTQQRRSGRSRRKRRADFERVSKCSNSRETRCRARPGGDAAAGRRAGRDGRDGKLDGMPSAGGDVLRARFRRRRLVLVQRRRLGLGFNRFGASFADPPPGFPFPGRADVKTSNRARARNRVLNDDRVRQPNQAMRPLSVRVMSLSSEKREREDATTARSPEGNERAVGYEPVADGADGDAAVAEDRRDRAPAAEATRREDVGDAAEPSHDGDAKEADGEADRKRKAQLDTELEREVKRGRVRVPATGLPPAPRAVGESADESAPRPRPPGRRATWQQTNIEEYFAKVKRPPRDRARRVEAKAGGESRGESRGGLYGFAKKAHAFLVERGARAPAALAALFLSRASRRRGRESTARMGKKNQIFRRTSREGVRT